MKAKTIIVEQSYARRYRRRPELEDIEEYAEIGREMKSIIGSVCAKVAVGKEKSLFKSGDWEPRN